MGSGVVRRTERSKVGLTSDAVRLAVENNCMRVAAWKWEYFPVMT